MIEAQFNMFDITVIAIMALSCLFAFFRGFVKEILSLGAWIGAGIITIYYFPEAAKFMKPYFKSETVAAGFATLSLYIGSLVTFSIINMFIMKFVKQGSDVGMLDNMMGLIFGAFRGALIVSLGFFLLTIAIPEKEYPEWLKQSITRPAVEKGARLLAKVAPDYLREISSLQKEAAKKAQAYRDGGDVETPEEESLHPSSGSPYEKNDTPQQRSLQLNRMMPNYREGQ